MSKREEPTMAEKMMFISGFLKIKPKYDKLKKARKIVSIVGLAYSCIVGLYGFVSWPIACYFVLFGGMGSLPTIYCLSSKMKEYVEYVVCGNVNYRYFKKMKKTGELQNLIDYHEELCKPHPYQNGIHLSYEEGFEKFKQENMPQKYKKKQKEQQNEREL